MPPHVGLRFYPGYRFYPTEQELLEFYLLHKIMQNPNLHQPGYKLCKTLISAIIPHMPNLIWDLYGGDQLLVDQTLYFFTQLKKVSPKGSRFNRKIGFSAWQGEDRAKHVLDVGSKDQILGFKKRFRYESRKNLEQNRRWIMHEFTINPTLLGDQYSHRALDFVLRRVIKNPNKQQEIVEEEALLAQQDDPIDLSCLDNILEIMESEVEIDSLPDKLVFDVQEFLSELDQIDEPRDEYGRKLQAVAWEEEMEPLLAKFLFRVNQVLNQVM